MKQIQGKQGLVREIGGEIIEENPRDTRFGSRYREVRETEGLRNRDSTVFPCAAATFW